MGFYVAERRYPCSRPKGQAAFGLTKLEKTGAAALYATADSSSLAEMPPIARIAAGTGQGLRRRRGIRAAHHRPGVRRRPIPGVPAGQQRRPPRYPQDHRRLRLSQRCALPAANHHPEAKLIHNAARGAARHWGAPASACAWSARARSEHGTPATIKRQDGSLRYAAACLFLRTTRSCLPQTSTAGASKHFGRSAPRLLATTWCCQTGGWT